MNYDYKNEITKFISGKRYLHTLAVEKECRDLADLFGLDEITKSRLSTAGFLHDITKEKTLAEQLELCERFHIPYSEEDKRAPKIFHAKTAACLARELYPDAVDDVVYGCIRWHTTGRADMTLPEKLVYLADYIEPTRTFEDCVTLRKFFYDKIKNSDKSTVLRDTLILSFDMTIRGLLDEGRLIDNNTVASRNALVMSVPLT